MFSIRKLSSGDVVLSCADPPVSEWRWDSVAIVRDVGKPRQRVAHHGDRKVGSPSPNESTNLHPVFLCERWDDTVQAQVLDKLSVVVGDVPDRNDRDTQCVSYSTSLLAFSPVVCAACNTSIHASNSSAMGDAPEQRLFDIDLWFVGGCIL